MIHPDNLIHPDIVKHSHVTRCPVFLTADNADKISRELRRPHDAGSGDVR